MVEGGTPKRQLVAVVIVTADGEYDTVPVRYARALLVRVASLLLGDVPCARVLADTHDHGTPSSWTEARWSY